MWTKLEKLKENKKMEKLPFLVLTSDVDDPSDVSQDRLRPSHLVLRLKTARGRKKKNFEGEWNAFLSSATIQ